MQQKKIIDVHTHLGLNTWEKAPGKTQSVERYVSTLLKTMDEFGVQQAFLTPIGICRQAEGIKNTIAENNNIAKAMQLSPDRFPIGLGIVESRHEEEAVKEAKRVLSELELQGLMPSFSSPVGPTLFPVMEVTSEYNSLCLIHSSPGLGSEPTQVGHLAKKFPRVTFIMGHPTLSSVQFFHTMEVCKESDNVYIDITRATSRQIEIFAEKIGAHKILFGSDHPFHKASHRIAVIEAADISDEDKENIFWGNAEGLIANFG